MHHVVNYIVNERKFISLQLLNERIQGFDYGLDEGGSKPPVINHTVDSVDRLNMKAIEMLRFVQNFAMICGNIIPEDDTVWGFYLTLRSILDLLFATRITTGELQLLQVLISEHHELYVDLFHDSLKPKHHFMVHYIRSIQLLGPLCWLWCMLFESKHGEAKKTASIVCNFKNICKSLSQKHQLKMCYRFLAKESLTDDDLVVGTGVPLVVDSTSTGDIAMFLAKIGITGQLFCANWITFNGTSYRPGHYLLAYMMTCLILPYWLPLLLMQCVMFILL